MMTIRSMITRAAVAAALATGATVLAAAPASASPNSWAAIAISVETGNIGYSYEQPSAAAAANAAENECGASDCQEVVRVTNGCAAVAQAPNLAWGWAYAASLGEAKREVVNATPGRGAEVLAYACTGTYLG
jgi:hypothetical protein